MTENITKEFDDKIRPFFERFWMLNPTGNERECFFHFKAVIKRKKYKNKEIRPEWLIEKYADYIDSLKPLQAGIYTKKENRVLDPIEWLLDDVFLQPIKKFKDPLDFYLYGIE